MGAELLRQAADQMTPERVLRGHRTRPITEAVADLLRAYADQERHTEAEDSPVDAAIHDLAEEILR